MNLDAIGDRRRRNVAAKWGITITEYEAMVGAGMAWCRRHRGWCHRSEIRRTSAAGNSGVCAACVATLKRKEGE
ncbi:MAG: hypothetical protein KGL39_52005 [Patescibacteria group bacterium]|nr:hypothetical protein [Patescibacteria group bacterium]